jgi:uncharacterized protein
MSTGPLENISRGFLTRRRFLTLALIAAPSIALANAVEFEPGWLKVSRYSLPGAGSPCTLVHISDLHHCGNLKYSEEIITAIKKENPDFVCFTGDLIDTSGHLNDALEFIRAIGVPVFGVPGNHDHACSFSFQDHYRAFEGTGGAWLMNQTTLLPDKSMEIVGLDGLSSTCLPPPAAPRRLVLTHYPCVADKLSGAMSTMVLAGHSHGGQVRLPLIGPLFLPNGVGSYDQGLFHTAAGPLHVSAGLGTSLLPVRFNCRPEITVIRI